MESILSNISSLVENKKINNAEETIMKNLIDLDPYLESAIDDTMITKIESILISLLSINNGIFSIQCAEFISSKLVLLFQKSKTPKLWDMLNNTITNTCSTTIIAAAYVCRFIGEANKAQLPRFIDHIVKNCSKFQFASIYALRIVFKVGGKTVHQFSASAFEFTNKILIDAKQHTVMMSIKFLKVLVESDTIPIASILETAKICLSKIGVMPFIQNEIAILVARCAYRPFGVLLKAKISQNNNNTNADNKMNSTLNNNANDNNKNSQINNNTTKTNNTNSTNNNNNYTNSEWAVVSRRNGQYFDFKQALTLISTFPTIMPQVFSNFIQLLGTEVTSLNHIQLFKFVRSFIPNEIPRLIPLLPGDSRFTYFREILKEPINVQQLKLLKILCPDDNCIKDAANIAFTLAKSADKESQKEAKDFFASLTRSHPFLVGKLLSSSLSALIGPKDQNNNTSSNSNNNNNVNNINMNNNVNNSHNTQQQQLQQKQSLNDSNPDLIIYGNSAVATAILSNLADKESAIQENKTVLDAIMKKAFANPNLPIFAACFELLIALPKQYAALSLVSKAVDVVMQQQIKSVNSKRLLKAVFAFRSKFSKPSQNSKLVDFALKITAIPLPLAVLTNLCSMIPKIQNNSEISYKASLIILKRAMLLQPSQPLTKSFFKHPLPLASELLGVKKQNAKTDHFLNQVIRKFPLLLAAASPKDQKTLMATVLEPKNQSIVTLLILASMSEARITRSLLPINLHKYLLSLLTSKNTNLLQSICECVALFTRSHTDVLPDVFDFIESHQTVSGCLLTSAVFAHVTVPNQYLLKAISYLDKQMTSHGTIAIAVHAMQSVVLTHSMQITAMASTTNQFPNLFATMHNAASLQPVTLKIIGDCFRSLVETFSSELVLVKSPVAVTVIISLKTLQFTPLTYAKEVYFDCCRSIYTFAHFLTSFAPISFPCTVGASENCQLAACEAFADFMKFEEIKTFEVEKIVPLLLSLLQRTGDVRAHHFIVSIAATMTEENVSFWVSTVRRVLVTSSLVDSTALAIEPTHEVKRVCVDISMYIVGIVANAFVLSTENLDDIVSSLCRANETGSVQLQEAAFPVLQKVIEFFKDRVTADDVGGGRLLDLYDSQFASVVKVGFQLSLAISGGFLSTYLTFNTDNMAKDPENSSAILVVYLAGLEQCQQRSTPFYSLATHLCTVGRKYPQIRTLIQPFLVTLTPIFAGIVLQAMQLWKSAKDESWRQMNEFRGLAKPFYGELLPAFVWLQTISNSTLIDVKVLVAFFVIEMKLARESWQSTAAFEALSASLDFCGAEIPSNLLELAIKTSLGFSGVDERQMLINSAALLKDEEEYDHLKECILTLCCNCNCNEIHNNNSSFINKVNVRDEKGEKISFSRKFSPRIFAYLLKSDRKRKSLEPFAFFIAKFIIDNFKEDRKITFDVANALLILVFDHSPSVINQTCDFVIGTKGLPTRFKLMVIDLGLVRLKEGDSLGQIPRYLISSFKKGGMHLIGHFLITKPELGIALLSKGAAKAAFLLSLKDMENTRAFLWFLQLSLKTLFEQSQNQNQSTATIKTDYNCGNVAKLFACSVYRLSAKMIEKCGNDPLNGRLIVWHCVRIIKDCQRIAGEKMLENVYKDFDEKEKDKFNKLLNQNIQSEIQTKKMQELVEFSTNERGKRNDEWQTLEIDDSD